MALAWLAAAAAVDPTLGTTCDDPHCVACVAGRCVYCEDGFYASGSVCVACEAPHCTKCAVAGRCTACETGYDLTYMTSDEDGHHVPTYGLCVKREEPQPIPHCTSRIGNTCFSCESGFHAEDGVCKPCHTAHCTNCAAVGRCIACEPHYTLRYIRHDDEGTDISRWGVCDPNPAVATSHRAPATAVPPLLLAALIAVAGVVLVSVCRLTHAAMTDGRHKALRVSSSDADDA